MTAAIEATTSVATRMGAEIHSSTSDSPILPILSEIVMDLDDDYWERLVEVFRQSEASEKLLEALLVESTANSVFESQGTSSARDPSPRIVEFMETAGGRNAALRDALNDLDEATAEVREEEFPVPSGLALANARRLLLAMYKLSPRRFEVYPTPDGEVAIDAPGGRGRSVVLLCDSDGGALCLVNMDGKHRRARYSDTGLLPDGFVREALDEVARRDELAA